MDTWFAIEFWFLALLSTWMTAAAILSFRGRSHREEDMNNLFEQVIGAVRSGDLPRAILLLEGEPGPLAALLSSVLTEATKFTPKLRVAYKITLETLRRRSQVTMSPLRVVTAAAPIVGVLGFLYPIAVLIAGSAPPWAHALWLLVISLLIGGSAHVCLTIADRQDRDNLLVAGDLGRKLLTYLLGPESPLPALRGRSFPAAE